MSYLFLVSLLLVIYGTLFPFSFRADANTGGILADFVHSVSVRPGGGDMVSNIVLFLPFGFLGMQILLARMPKFVSILMVFVLGTATSLGIEIAQHFMTTRNTSVYDLGFNALSALIGALVGSVNWQQFITHGGGHGMRPRSIFPLIMVTAWAAYRLFPYVPTLDFQRVKDAIKPLLDFHSLPIADSVRHFGMVIGLALLLQAIMPPLRARLALAGLALGVIAAKPFIIIKVISPAEVVGTVTAMAVWLTVLSRAHARTRIAVVIFAVTLALQGLTPFELRSPPADFSFVPFVGFEQGSMAVNIQSFLEKLFLYGTFVWLALQAVGSVNLSLAFVTLFITGIEVSQRYIIGRSPEVTDPMLALIMGGVLLALEGHHRSNLEIK
jgi:glycopeptide antibiotics resistance protein